MISTDAQEIPLRQTLVQHKINNNQQVTDEYYIKSPTEEVSVINFQSIYSVAKYTLCDMLCMSRFDALARAFCVYCFGFCLHLLYSFAFSLLKLTRYDFRLCTT